MILAILSIVITILGFILILISDRKNWGAEFPAFLMVLGIFGCFMCGIIIVCENGKKSYDRYYEEWNRKYLGLEVRVEAWNKGSEDLYLWDDVKEFNSSLENAQHFANSYWTNWLSEQACNEFETFDIPEYRRSEE